MRSIYRTLRILGDAKTAARGPAPLARRKARAHSHRLLARALRKVLKP